MLVEALVDQSVPGRQARAQPPDVGRTALGSGARVQVVRSAVAALCG